MKAAGLSTIEMLAVAAIITAIATFAIPHAYTEVKKTGERNEINELRNAINKIAIRKLIDNDSKFEINKNENYINIISKNKIIRKYLNQNRIESIIRNDDGEVQQVSFDAEFTSTKLTINPITAKAAAVSVNKGEQIVN